MEGIIEAAEKVAAIAATLRAGAAPRPAHEEDGVTVAGGSGADGG
jgi:hypothetical protein